MPRSVRAAWGVLEPAAKGPKRGLSLEAIVAAAVAVADAEGLTALSMARVAAALGASTMALYRYVATKEELLALMADAALGAAPDLSGEWRAALTAWAWAEHDAYRRHPWVLRIPISGPPLTPNTVAWFEAGLAATAGTGLRPAERASALLLVSGFVRNAATLTADLIEAQIRTGTGIDEAMAAYRQNLEQVIDSERFPSLSEVLTTGVFDVADDPDDEFRFGLDRILDGLDVLIRSRG